MRHFSDAWIQEWCDANGWTDLFMERLNHYWAFPPGAVMPEPIPSKILRYIKLEKGLCPEERAWLGAALGISVLGALGAYCWQNPMPFLFAFAFGAVTAGRLEVEEI
ncbi:MAG: hypothetical protein GC158_04995 [Cyanobacteria bacterium RI_101]|nr:hypothetical protein [Cyanobacteria bacterium RI_101]